MQKAEKIKKGGKTLIFRSVYVKIILPNIIGKYPKEEKTMKNVLRILIAIALAISCVFACTSCSLGEFDLSGLLAGITGGNNNGGGEGDGEEDGGGSQSGTVKPPSGSIDTSDDYRLRFVYSYTAKVVNANDRTEYKKEIKTVDSIYIPRTNSGFTADVLAQVEALSYHGFTFDTWYTEWDTETQSGVPGTEYDFSASVVDKDVTLYGSRGDTRADWLAGPNATYEIVEVYDDGTTSKDPVVDSGETEGEEVEKTVKDVILYVRGTGSLFNFTNPNEIDVPWHDKADKITKLVVEEGITVIGANAFGNLTKLKSVQLPNTVTTIGDSAFAGCTNAAFRSFTCPDSLVTIERNAFNNTSLREVILNDGLKTIKENAFYKSNKIMSIVVPTSLESVGMAAFHPGAVGSTNNSHALSKIYYKGFTTAEWSTINIGMDNSWFADLPTIYYYTADESIGNDTTAPIPYWHYADVNGVLTNIPAQYCYSIKYYLPSGSKAPIKTIYVPVQEKIVNGELQYTEDGVLILEGVITKDVVDQQNNIVYHGYRFASFTPEASAIYEGMIINNDRSYTGQRGDILSDEGGIRWEKLEGGHLRIYKDETTAERVAADVLAKYTAIFTAEEEAKISAALDAEIAAGSFVLEGDSDYAKSEAKKAELALRIEIAAELTAATVADRVAADDVQSAMQAEIDERLEDAFRIWDFENILDTGNLWTGSITSVGGIKTLIIEEGVEYIGQYAFNSLSVVKELVIPASIEEIHTTAFEACSAMVAILYTGTIADSTCVGLSELEKPGVVSYSTKLYELATEATSANGRFWMQIDDSHKITWELDGGKITIGGSDELADFASAEDAPWYGAKDRITAASFVSNVKYIPENIFNGYTNLTSLSLPIELRKLPESAFANTGLVNNVSAYKNGLLLVDGHLLKVDASKISGNRYEMEYGIFSVAGGAFEGVSITELKVSASVQCINAGAFPDANIKKIYSESGKNTWLAVSANAGFSDSVKVYYFSASDPAFNTALDPTDRYYYAVGGEYITWGCDHEYSKWQVETAPSCIANGIEVRYCKYDRTHIETREIPKTGVHVYVDEWQVKTPGTDTEHEVLYRPCSTYGCTAVEEKTVHVFDEYVDNGDGVTETAKCELCDETHTRNKED